MKVAKPVAEKKTPGTLTVEKHRPLMNKLTDAQRQELMRAGLRRFTDERHTPAWH